MTGGSVDIVLCGDILPVRPLEALSASNLDVFAMIASGDFSLGNFEMPLTERGAPVQKLLNVRVPPAVAHGIGQLGLNAVTLANNHAPDFGWDGLDDTRRALEMAGIATVGIGKDLDEAARPMFSVVNGVRIGVLAFSCLTPTGAGAAPGRPGISPLHVVTGYEIDPWYQMEEPGDPACLTVTTRVREDDLARAAASVAAARADCDILIATVHWGFGSSEALAQYQRPLAETLIEAGADIVHGHHPHAIHAFGFYRGRPILFSANVLIGQQVFLDASDAVKALWSGMSADGFVTRLRWRDGSIEAIEILPTVLDADRLPEFARAGDGERILSRLSRLSAAHGASVHRSGERILAEPSL